MRLTEKDDEKLVIFKPHIFFLNCKWHCLRDWNLKRTYRSQAPSWQRLLIPEEERWTGNNEHNLFIQDDIFEGWKEYCIETWFYPETDFKGRCIKFGMWYNTPLCCGLAAFVH